jgi:hypothetical protein
VRAWVATIYVANRWGSMQERTLTFGLSLPKREVEVRVQKKLAAMQLKGISVYPQYDLQQEMVA